MKTLKTLEPLTNRLLDIQRINSAASVLSWDQETYMPNGAAEAQDVSRARAESFASVTVSGRPARCSPITGMFW